MSMKGVPVWILFFVSTVKPSICVMFYSLVLCSYSHGLSLNVLLIQLFLCLVVSVHYLNCINVKM